MHGAWLDGDPPVERCGHRPDEIEGIRVLRSTAVDDGPLILYLHGGGFALGSPDVALPITERLTDGGLEIVSVDYRLAPEHPCPAAITDSVAVARAVSARAGGRSLVLAGDSAGANLAISVAQQLRDGGGAGATGLLLLSPHVDHGVGRAPGNGHDRPSDVDRAAARWLAAAYRGSLSSDDHRLSPLRGDLGGLPPILIQVGSIDTSFEQSARLASEARSAGVEVVLDVWEGLWHTWHYHRDLPEADLALAEAAAWVRRLSVWDR